MPCLHPITIQNPKYKKWIKDYNAHLNEWSEDYTIYDLIKENYGSRYPDDYYIQVPCGHCSECCKRRSRE